MKAPRLLQTTIALAAISFGTAYAHQSITVNYDALDRLPERSSTQKLVAPKLVPPSLVRRQAVPPYAGAYSNRPVDVGANIPPLFERNDTLYNGPEIGGNANGVTGAAGSPAAPQETAMLTPPAYAPPQSSGTPLADDHEAMVWGDAKPVGKVLFQNDGYEVLDLDRGAIAELDRLAHRIGNSQQRILLRAFGGQAGDESHEAHRMALKRGLAVRRYLIARGVSSSLIDVTAVGGATDGGPTARVDVMASNG